MSKAATDKWGQRREPNKKEEAAELRRLRGNSVRKFKNQTVRFSAFVTLHARIVLLDSTEAVMCSVVVFVPDVFARNNLEIRYPPRYCSDSRGVS